MPTDDDFDRSAFVNCPFDEDYGHILQAVLFCLVRFGLKPRIATERSDAGESRVNKIVNLIRSSKYSVHDLCRCQAQAKGEHYRLNMPFELGSTSVAATTAAVGCQAKSFSSWSSSPPLPPTRR